MSLPVCVLGAGNWGTILSLSLASDEREVRMWCNDAQLLDEIRLLGENRTFLPGVPLPQHVKPTTELADAIVRYVTDPGLAERMAAQARQDALERFSHTAQCEGWERLLSELTG